jgi:hypothetical protein
MLKIYEQQSGIAPKGKKLKQMLLLLPQRLLTSAPDCPGTVVGSL